MTVMLQILSHNLSVCGDRFGGALYLVTCARASKNIHKRGEYLVANHCLRNACSSPRLSYPVVPAQSSQFGQKCNLLRTAKVLLIQTKLPYHQYMHTSMQMQQKFRFQDSQMPKMKKSKNVIISGCSELRSAAERRYCLRDYMMHLC